MVVDEKSVYQWRRVGNQYIAVLTVSLMNLAAGIANGWMTPMIPILMASDAPLLNGPLSNEEISWISAFFSVGSISGSFLSTLLTAFIGSKHSTTFTIIPSIAFSLYTYLGNTFTHMLIGRILAGIIHGVAQSTILIYTSEISNDDKRGRFCSMGLLSRNIGVLLCFMVSSYLGYEHIPTISLILSIAFALIFVFLPSTPLYYLRKQQYQQAGKALEFYKGYKGDKIEETAALSLEFKRIRKIAEEGTCTTSLQLSDLCNKQALKGLAIAIVLQILMVTIGNKVILNYAIPMFEASSSHINADIASMLLAFVHIIGCLCSTQFADILGRKCLMIVSLAGCALGLAAFASYSQLSVLGIRASSFEWFPVAVILFSNLMGSSGVSPLASLCAVESLPPRIRGFGLAMSLIVMQVVSFIALKTFPIWMESFGLSVTFLIYAAGCISGMVFVFVFIREMTGKCIDDIPANK